MINEYDVEIGVKPYTTNKQTNKPIINETETLTTRTRKIYICEMALFSRLHNKVRAQRTQTIVLLAVERLEFHLTGINTTNSKQLKSVYRFSEFTWFILTLTPTNDINHTYIT